MLEFFDISKEECCKVIQQEIKQINGDLTRVSSCIQIDRKF